MAVPYTFSTVTTATGAQLDADFAYLVSALAGYAALAGSSAQNFSVADATTAHHAVSYEQAFGIGQANGAWSSGSFGTTYTNGELKAEFFQLYVIMTGVGTCTIGYYIDGSLVVSTTYASPSVVTLALPIEPSGTVKITNPSNTGAGSAALQYITFM